MEYGVWITEVFLKSSRQSIIKVDLEHKKYIHKQELYIESENMALSQG